MRTVIRLVVTLLSAGILAVVSQAQVTQLWESPSISGETGTIFSFSDSSYSFVYIIDTVAQQMRLHSTTTFSLTYTLSGVRPYEYPVCLLPDMNGSGSPEVLLQYYSLPGYAVRIRDASTGLVLNSWSDATISYYVWQVFQSPGNRILKLAMRKTNVTTSAATFIVYSLGVAPNSVAPTPKGNLPSQLMLEQNYPNPFNPSTIIRYEIPSAGTVTLSVYDAAGRLVRTFDTTRQEAGAHEVLWNGRDDHGLPVASGMYFYKLSVDNMSQTKKMVLLH